MQIIHDTQLDYCDVLIAPQTTNINHRGEVEVIRDFKQLPGFKCCPIMNANMTQTGTFEVAKALIFEGMIGCIHKFYTAEQICDFLDKEPECRFHKEFFITIGLRNQAEEVLKLRACEKYKEWSILIDVPNAYIPEVEDFVKHIRYEFPDRIIAVGNVCTGDRTQELIKAGANIIKVGIGPSAVCRTRHTTGCGRPQLSAVIECANAAHQVGGLIIADGGFNLIGDFAKAFVAGADICMSGSMFAGCDEAAGEIIEKMYRTNEYEFYEETNTNRSFNLEFKDDESVFFVLVGNNSIPSRIITDSEELKIIKAGTFIKPIGCTLIKVPATYRNEFESQLEQSIQDIAGIKVSYIPDKPIYENKKFKEYYGMSSFRAQCENYGKKTITGTSEGVESKLIPYTGPIIDTINNIKGGLRSTGSYIGAKNIKNFSRQGSFYKTNRTQ